MKKIITPLICSIFSLIIISSVAGQQKWLNLNYGDDQMVGQQLDIYLPDGDKEAWPVVIVIYGSAFFGNDLKDRAYETLGQHLLKAGFSVVTINHRASTEAIFPAQIHDVKAAIRFLRAHADQYKLDQNFIGITGYSSGGHLASMAGTTNGLRNFILNGTSIELEGEVGSFQQENSYVNAVVDWFGPTDFLIMDSCGSTMQHDAPDSPESTLIGGPIQENIVKSRLADPATYIHSGTPPFLIIHGDEDPLVPLCQSEWLHKNLDEKGIDNHLVVVNGGKHGPGVFTEKYFKMMVEFFLNELSKI